MPRPQNVCTVLWYGIPYPQSLLSFSSPGQKRFIGGGGKDTLESISAMRTECAVVVVVLYMYVLRTVALFCPLPSFLPISSRCGWPKSPLSVVLLTPSSSTSTTAAAFIAPQHVVADGT